MAQLLLNGKFSEAEREELNQLLAPHGIEVREYITKGIEPKEMVRAVFHSFDALAFLRDATLAKVVELLSRTVWTWVRSRKSEIKPQIAFELVVGEEKPRITVVLPKEIDDFSNYRAALETFLTLEFIETARAGEIVSISWDENTDQLKVIRF